MPTAKNPAMQNNVFVDADALVAISDINDSNHKRATNLAEVLREENLGLFISSFAFGEALTVVSQNVNLKKAVDLGRSIRRGMCSIIEVGSRQIGKAFVRFSKQTSKNSRFTDMVNMVLMDELKIDTIFSFDGHYPNSGFKLLSTK